MNNIAIVWVSDNQVDSNSETDIYLRMLTKDLTSLGEELIVNDITNGLQEKVQIASNKKGNYVVVWSSFEKDSSESFFDIKAKLFNQNGSVTRIY